MVECAGLPVRPILLAPHSGDVRDWVQAFPEFDVCRLSDRWFRSTSTYSELMVSPTLYESLVQHEWLLICQIDAVIMNPPRLDGEERSAREFTETEVAARRRHDARQRSE